MVKVGRAREGAEEEPTGDTGPEGLDEDTPTD